MTKVYMYMSITHYLYQFTFAKHKLIFRGRPVMFAWRKITAVGVVAVTVETALVPGRGQGQGHGEGVPGRRRPTPLWEGSGRTPGLNQRVAVATTPGRGAGVEAGRVGVRGADHKEQIRELLLGIKECSIRSGRGLEKLKYLYIFLLKDALFVIFFLILKKLFSYFFLLQIF